MSNLNNWPDPFDEPHRYWLMIVNCPATKERDKRQQLRAVGLDFDIEPKAKQGEQA